MKTHAACALIPTLLPQGEGLKTPLLGDDCMDAGGRAKPGAFAEKGGRPPSESMDGRGRALSGTGADESMDGRGRALSGTGAEMAGGRATQGTVAEMRAGA